MIKKKFTITLPDEPFKTTTVKNIQVDGWYEGPRYLVVRAKDGIADTVLVGADEESSIDLSRFIEEGHRFFILDASQNPLPAAYLSRFYKTDEIPNYVETIETGETWEYVYEDFTGVLDQIYVSNKIPVDENNQFGEPQRREHGVTRESIFQGFLITLEQLRSARETNDYTPEQLADLDNWEEWLTTAESRYANTEHWKITFPLMKF